MAMTQKTFEEIKRMILDLAFIKTKMLELEFNDEEDNIRFESEVNYIDSIIGELIVKLRN